MLIASCRKLADNPELFGLKYGEIAEGLYGYITNKHIIFYRITEAQEVEIVRILHERMDLKNRIEE